MLMFNSVKGKETLKIKFKYNLACNSIGDINTLNSSLDFEFFKCEIYTTVILH